MAATGKKDELAAARAAEAEHRAEVEAMVARLERGREQWRDVRWPGGKMMVRLRVLTTGETQEATAAAFKRFRELDLEINGLTLDAFAAEQVTQVLARACLDPARPVDGRADDWRPMFRTAAVLREAATADERAAVWVEYEELRAHADPSPDQVLDEETIADIDEALKKRSLPLLASIGSWRLAIYMLTTAAQPSPSPTDKSISTSDNDS